MCTRGRVLKRQLETTNWEALVGVFKHGLRTAATAVMSTVCEPMIALGVGRRPTRDSDGHRWSYKTILTRAGRSGCGTQPEARRAKREIWWCKVKISTNFFAHACGIADVAGDVDTDVMDVAD